MSMKKFTLFTFLSLATVYLMITGFGGSSKYPGGSPAGYTGSPGDGKDCTQCHGGTSTFVDNWITSNVPDNGYVPGTTYDISVTVSGSGDKGFLLSPQNLTGDQLGILVAGPQTKLVGVTKYITQTTGSSSNPKTWQFQWTAPETGTGDVVLYGAFTVNKPVTKLSTLTLKENSGVGLSENLLAESKLYPNPTSGFVNLEFVSDPQNVNLNLLGLDGRVIKSFSASPDKKQKLDLSSVSAGVYILRIQQQSQMVYKKIVVR
jgi:type IX secretion system substrate protein